ncbi:hypothetical protein [Endozoicomonas sp. ALD040]|uniref:hypothetical protein n=1 Tax=unclassified Endozoicomonas TaxID=2644528 RepID=UPI003BB14A81
MPPSGFPENVRLGSGIGFRRSFHAQAQTYIEDGVTGSDLFVKLSTAAIHGLLYQGTYKIEKADVDESLRFSIT